LDANLVKLIIISVLFIGLLILFSVLFVLPKIHELIKKKIAINKYESEVIKATTYKFANSTNREDLEPYEIIHRVSFNTIWIRKMVAQLNTLTKKWEFSSAPDAENKSYDENKYELKLTSSSEWRSARLHDRFILSEKAEMNYQKKIPRQMTKSLSNYSYSRSSDAVITPVSSFDDEALKVQKKILATQRQIASNSAQSASIAFASKYLDK
jgi:lipopolysaccharide export LptBFGC system permease protein LptF